MKIRNSVGIGAILITIIGVLVAVLVMGLTAGCSKSALSPGEDTYFEDWVVQEGHDIAAWNAAQFCFPQDYGVIDTIRIFYTKKPDNINKFAYVVGSIYFPPKDGRIETDIPNIYSRHYAKLLQKTREGYR